MCFIQKDFMIEELGSSLDEYSIIEQVLSTALILQLAEDESRREVGLDHCSLHFFWRISKRRSGSLSSIRRRL